MGNVYAVLVQCVGSVQAACNPHNPHAPGPVFLHYLGGCSLSCQNGECSAHAPIPIKLRDSFPKTMKPITL